MTPNRIAHSMACRCAGILLLFSIAVSGARHEAAGQSEVTAARISDVRLGFANHFKVGHWTPVWVEVEGVAAPADLRVEITTADSDGVPTTASAPVQPAASAGDRPAALVYTKFGRLGGDARATLFFGEQQLDSRTVQPVAASGGETDVVELSATSELAVTMGAEGTGITEAFPNRDAADGQPARRVIRLGSVAQLPPDWFGYEAVNVLIFAADDSILWSELVADKARFAALVEWLELGGRLVILCGGEEAPQLLAEGKPLVSLAPGKLADVVRLPETGALEHFANSEAPLVARGATSAISVPSLTDIDGVVEVYVGRRSTDLPLVIRSARGLGEIAFAGLDLTKPPLSIWSGRTALVEALLRPYFAQDGGGTTSAQQSLVTRGYNDLSGAFRQRLGRSFAAVAPITFPFVTMLALAYMLVLGPLDYFVVHRWLRRPWLAWVTFPLIVLAFGFTALAIADWRTGGGSPRVNRMELVDIDLVTGRARGTFWATLYSPHANQFDLTLSVDSLAKPTAGEPEVRLSWWGLPGAGIGGMQAKQTEAGIIRAGYHFSPDGKSLKNVPVLTSATKSLMARWTTQVAAPMEAQLADVDGLATGFVVNQTGQPLQNVRLFYNGWAYVLGNVKLGGRMDVSADNSPRRVKTIVTQSAIGTAAASQSEEGVFVAERATAKQILNLMMFFRAAGGYAFAGLPNDYLTFCDLSRLPDLGRAVLVAELPIPGSRLVDADNGEPLGDDRDQTTVVYRFVLPVAKNTNDL